MIRTAYTWDKPIATDPRLVTMARLKLRSPGMTPGEAVERFRQHFPQPLERWTLADHPPVGPKAFPHSYELEFDGDLYDGLGLLAAAHKLRYWFGRACEHLLGLGWPAPECMPIDWEGYPFRVDYRKDAEVEEHARARAAAIRYCLIEPAQQTWGVRIPAGNYEDRGYPGDRDINKKPFPTPVVGSLACPVFYGEPWRERFSADDLRRDMVLSFERARIDGRDFRPWLDGARPDLLAFAENLGVESVLLWGDTDECQRWLLEHWGVSDAS